MEENQAGLGLRRNTCAGRIALGTESRSEAAHNSEDAGRDNDEIQPPWRLPRPPAAYLTGQGVPHAPRHQAGMSYAGF